jgi:hypothetical protein
MLNEEGQSSRGRLRIADRSAGSNDAHRASHGRFAGRIRRVRALDPARAGSRRIGSCPAEWEAPGGHVLRREKPVRCGSYIAMTSVSGDRAPAQYREHLGAPYSAGKDSNMTSSSTEFHRSLSSSGTLPAHSFSFGVLLTMCLIDSLTPFVPVGL